ncbi:putative flavin reductase domain protein fmn-binding protein [Botrytis fragariae]|uniref:Putative flavin reductase domain protein fmn-binding protein n=1 Tax=Botrytis fragariae TaxID=1964551 RepID=A0A8H6AVU5_9HELO|nr:putative flavin reductase domain protein fmn-binding protein [Botrytis fragariae]KAF5874400.1 putative flavin reductase domain protein fmn-binding protein [Botrytis fragariae]
MSRPDIFYQPPKGENSGLPHDPFKSFVIPRPIGWISTTSKSGQDNLAPFSQFNNVSFDPPTIMFIGHQSVYKRQSKDSINNAKDTGEFVWNMATYDLRGSVNATALESWDDEFPLTKVTKVPSKVVKPPRVAESPVQFECKVHSILRITGDSLVGHSDIVIGRVVGIHIRGDFITGDGLFDVLKAAPLARLGYHQYTAINNIFEMEMPFMPDDHVSGNTLGGVVPKDIDDEDVANNGSEVKKTIALE